MPTAVLLSDVDNLCVAARDLQEGESVEIAGIRITMREPVRAGHKVALCDIAVGQPVLKFGQPIGLATQAIRAGEWIHVHNIAVGVRQQEYEKSTAIPPAPVPLTGHTFQGYPRADGRVGTRNYLAIISNVNCSASVAKYVAKRFTPEVLRDYPNVDGVLAFSHGSGCGMEFKGDYHRMLNRVMGGIARHPNIGGYLLIGLGCETGTLGSLIDDQRLVQIHTPGDKHPPTVARPAVLVMQDLGGTQKTIDAAVKKVSELLPQVNRCRRETVPASKLVLGTNCGGSDGNSGITANLALGVASDMIVACGGTTILAETTEIYGAEQLLMRRACTPAVADKLLERIRWWEWYTGVFGCTPDNNPSPGNKEGGLTTIYEKSLGAIIKGGTTALNEVYQYAEQVTAPGLVVMDTPGLDCVSVTGIVAGGANIVAFTTGRGSCLGSKPAPTIKIASNTPMYERMVDDMDINAGTILSAGRTAAEIGEEIFAEILAVASGKQSKSEQLGLGDEEFQPWILGPTL
ncbi:MAG: altronate dehydratase family protein [Planctomycetota bacterium]|nr:altronate dehydratase family protein [Planctomycetota bacterium]